MPSILDVTQILQQIPQSPYAPVLFVASHVVLAVLWLPCSPLTLAAGLIWGSWVGLAYSMTAVMASCATTYMLGRFAGHALLQICPKRHVARMKMLRDTAYAADWRVVAAVNLSPVFPAATMGYVFGLARTPARLYLAVTALSLLPYQVAYVFMGDGIADLAMNRGPWFLAGGLALAILATLLIRRHRRKP